MSNLKTISDPQENCVPVQEKYNQKEHSRERINILEKKNLLEKKNIGNI